TTRSSAGALGATRYADARPTDPPLTRRAPPQQRQNHRPLPRQRRGTSTHAPPLTAHLTERPHRHITAKPTRRRCACTNRTHKRHTPTPHHACTQPRTLEQCTPRARTTPDPRTTHAGPTHALDPEPNLPTTSRPLPTAHFRRAVGQCDSTARTPAATAALVVRTPARRPLPTACLRRVVGPQLDGTLLRPAAAAPVVHTPARRPLPTARLWRVAWCK
ncbi:hypothetical protein DXG01_012992, partial [Tephrocybe rancida]